MYTEMAPNQRISSMMVVASDNDYSNSYSTTIAVTNNNHPHQHHLVDKSNNVEMKNNNNGITSSTPHHHHLSTTMMKSSSTTTNSSTMIIKKRTRFALSNNEIFPIPHINDLSDEEVKDVWYEKVEYDTIKNDLIPIVKRIMKRENIQETNQLTIRGLEYRTRKGAIKRQHNKVEAMTAVLDEQDRQIELDIYEPELISQVYLEVSAKCLLEAQELAAGDVKPAREYCLSPTITLSSSNSSLNNNNKLSSSSHHSREGPRRTFSTSSQASNTSKDSNKSVGSISKMLKGMKMGVLRRSNSGGANNNDNTNSTSSSSTERTSGEPPLEC